MSGLATAPHASARRRAPPVPVLGRVLGAVLLLVVDLVERGDVAAQHALAVVVDLIELVGEHGVAPVAAVDEVDLAVADPEAVVAEAAGQLVAVGVADRRDVLARQRPQHVVAVAAVGVVAALVGEQLVGSSTAVERVVVVPARDELAAGAAVDDVGAGAAVQPLADAPPGIRVARRLRAPLARAGPPPAPAGPAFDGVVAGAGEDVVTARSTVEHVVAGVADQQVEAGAALGAVVAGAREHEVGSGERVDGVIAALRHDPVALIGAGEGVRAAVADDLRRHRGGGRDETQRRNSCEREKSPVTVLHRGILLGRWVPL
jgi:hypothetical protein